MICRYTVLRLYCTVRPEHDDVDRSKSEFLGNPPMQSPDQELRVSSRADSAAKFLFPFVTFFGLTLSPGFGSVAIVFFILPSVLFLSVKAKSFRIQGRVETRGVILMFMMPALFLVSTFWSHHPDVTLRLALEALVSCGVVFLLSCSVRLTTLISAFFFAQLLSVGASVLSGKTAIIYETQQAAYVGFYGSKNYFAFAGLVLFLLSIAAAGISKSGYSRISAYFGILLSLLTLFLTISAGAAISFLFIALMYFMLHLVSRINVRSRGQVVLAAIIAALCAACIAGLIFGDENGLAGALLSLVGKDATLTGRTELWTYASGLIEQRPLFGIGYQAFWVQNDAAPEALWDAFHIPTRLGFHFHNQFYATAVELGYLGVALTSFYLAAIIIASIRAVLRHYNTLTVFLFQIVVLTLSRIYTEVDLLAPFSIGWILTLFAAAYLFKLDPASSRAQTALKTGSYPVTAFSHL